MSERRRASISNYNVDELSDLNLVLRRFIKKDGANASPQDVGRLYQSAIRLPSLFDDMGSEENSAVLKKASLYNSGNAFPSWSTLKLWSNQLSILSKSVVESLW